MTQARRRFCQAWWRSALLAPAALTPAGPLRGEAAPLARWLMTMVVGLAAAGLLAGCGPSVAGVGPGAEDQRLKQLAVTHERALGANDCATEWDQSTRDWQRKHSPRDHWVAECQSPPFEAPPTPEPSGTTYTVVRLIRPSDGHAQVVVHKQAVAGERSFDSTVFLVRESDGRWAVEVDK